MTSEIPMAPRAAPAHLSQPRLFYWSVRREIWEHRSIYIAPAAVAGVALFGFLIGAVGVANRVREVISGVKKGGAIEIPYDFVAFAVVMTGLLVAVVYSIGALHGERRDRSILFWKSLPVSDAVTVLAKAAVPILVLPPVLFAVIIAAQLVMAAASTLVVAANGLPVQVLWDHLPLAYMLRVLAEGLPFIALWYAPIYAWLMLVSAWAKRAPYLWAIAVPLGLALVERLALGTHAVGSWLSWRIAGAFAGMGGDSHGKMMGGHHVNPPGWTSPEFWVGLVLAAAFLAGAAWLRRSREPI